MYYFTRIVLCILICLACLATRAQNWDINITRSLNPQYPHSAVVKGITNSAYPVGILAPLSLLAAGGLTHDSVTLHRGIEMAASVAGTVLVTKLLKSTVGRQRPYDKYPSSIYPYKLESTASFPSGHTSASFATATTFSLEYKKWYVVVPAYAWAAGVGYSRLYLGEHYFTDVVAGAALGTAGALASHWINKKIKWH